MDKVNEINNLLKKFIDTNNIIYYNKLKRLLNEDSQNNYLRFNLAVLETDMGLINNAIEKYKFLLDSEYKIKALTNIYLIEISKRSYASALKYIDKLLDINKNDREVLIDKSNVLNSLGLLSHELRESKKAEKNFLKALEINNDSLEIINNLAGFYREEGNYKKAIKLYKKALLLDQKNVTVINNLSKTFFDMNNMLESKKYAFIGKEIDKNNSDLRNNLSFIYLKEQKYYEAWRNFEGRLHLPNFKKNNLYSNILIDKIYKGNKLKYDDNILVVREQGIGDEILYSSMYKDLLKNFDNVTIECDRRLKKLFNNSFNKHNCFRNFGEITNDINKLKKYNVVLYAGSLGRFFRNKLTDFEGNQYIFAENKRIQNFKSEFNKFDKKHKIGVSWKSFKNRYSNEKSITLKELISVLETKDCTLISLQYGNIKSELFSFNDQSEINIQNLNKLDIYNDFDNLAAALSNLDLFITVSNSTAHLAGALGVKTILVKPINHATYHYWNQNGKKTPWYKSLTLVDKNKFFANKHSLLNLVNKNK